MPDYTHVHLMNHFKAMGYSLPGSGICAGLAQMSIQAFLAGSEEFARFNQRLELIATSSPVALRRRIDKAREAIAERSRKKRIEAKLGEKEIIPVDLSEEEELLTETEAFFGGVEAYLYPGRHRDLFAKSVPQPRAYEVIPFMESTALVAQGSMRVTDSFPGIYSLDELQDYFKRLTQVILHYCPPCDIAMGLSSINHRISILFDRTRGTWILNDANQLPSKEISNPAELTDAVFIALAKKTGEGSAATIAAFNTTVYATRKQEIHVKKIMAAVKKSAEFSRAHEVTLRKVNERTGVLKVSLANIATKFEHSEVLKAIAAAKVGALNEGGHFGGTPLHTATGLNIVEIVKMLAGESVSLEVKDKNGRTPLAMAIKHSSVEAMTVLLDEEKSLVSAAVNAAGWLPLYLAVEENDVEAIKLLVEKGADPLVEIAGGWSPIALAARTGSVESLEALIAIAPKINLEKEADGGTTPLMLAAIGGHSKIVNYLAEKKVDLNKKHRVGNSALHLAVKNNHFAVVEALILGGATVDVEDNAGNTPLHLAAKQNLKDIYDLLIKHGAKTSKKNRVGKTPLSPGFIADSLLAVISARDLMLKKIASLKARFPRQAGYQAALEQLHKDVLRSYEKIAISAVSAHPSSAFYASLSPEMGLTFVAAENDNSAALFLLHAEEKINFETENADFRSLLHVAVYNDSRKILDALISKGADLTHEVKSSGATVVYLAAVAGLTELLRKIVANVPVRFLNKTSAKNESPFYAAVYKGHDQAARLLLEAGVDVNCASNSGWSPLHISIVQNYSKIFEMLVEKADLTQELGGTGVTPVALAAEYGRSEFLRTLISKAPLVDIKKKSSEGLTPLMYAVKNRQIQAAKLLIDALETKDLNEQDNNGEAALHFAIENNDIELVHALISKGADVNLARTSDGKTPIQLAVLKHQVEIVKLLRSHRADLQKVDSSGNCALSIGSPLAEATTRKKQIFIALDAWMEELQQGQPSRSFPVALGLEFSRLQQLIEKDFEANYETFVIKYDEELFDTNSYLLFAFLAAEGGYKNILETLVTKIDVGALNPAGLTLSQVAEANNHLELVRILQGDQASPELQEEVELPHVGLFSRKTSVPPPSITPRDSVTADSCYAQLKETIMEEAQRLATELEAQPRFISSRHSQMLKSIDIQTKLDECDKAASKQADKYHYLKAQCEDKHSLLYHALHLSTANGAESATSPIKNVLDKIAELDARIAASDLKPES